MIGVGFDRENHDSILAIMIGRELKLFDIKIHLRIRLVDSLDRILMMTKKVFRKTFVYKGRGIRG